MIGKKLLVALASGTFGLCLASAAVPTHGLVGLFNFDSGYSNSAGPLGSDVTGTFVNGAAITATGATVAPHTTGGYSGYDLFLNAPATLSGGVNVPIGYGAATPSTANLGQNFTVSIRFKSAAVSGANTSNRYFLYEGQTDYDASLSLDASAAGANTSPPTTGAPGSLHFYSDGGGSFSTGPSAIAPNTWYNVIQTYDATSVAGKTVITTYLNGVSVGSITNTNTAVVTDSGFNFGRARNGSNNRGFNGNLDEIGLWNRVLTPSEISSIGTTAPELGAVFVIALENHNWVQPTNKFTGSLQQIYQNPAAPYINSLVTVGHANAAQSSWASNYTGTGVHPSEPNYIWAEAGTNFGVSNDNGPYGTGGNNQNTSAHFTGVLSTLGESWMSYQEDIDLNYTTGAVLAQSSWIVPLTSKSGTLGGGATNPYNGGTHYNYQPKHNPPVFFTDTNGGNDATHANAQWVHYSPLQQLQADLSANAVAIYNWITPNMDNDMHDALSAGFTYNGTTYTGDAAKIAQGDNFLSRIVPMIQASDAYKNNGLIIIWEDETEGGNTAAYTQPFIVLSPLAKGNAYRSTYNYTHSSTLKTLQEIFQTGTLFGGSANAGVNDESDLFQSGVIPATVGP